MPTLKQLKAKPGDIVKTETGEHWIIFDKHDMVSISDTIRFLEKCEYDKRYNGFVMIYRIEEYDKKVELEKEKNSHG